MSKKASSARQLVVCVKNEGYVTSLETRKIYVALPDSDAENNRQIRVIDESGEDYLYPRSFFVPISLPQPARKAVLTAA
ncbi:MAG: hypothetical protein ACKVP2_04000 [Burkholderiales bacterium]